MVGLITERPRTQYEIGGLRGSIQPVRSQRCSDFVSPCATQAVLLVGAERADEFADAMRLVCEGHDVIVVNPRETAAARAFRRAGGTFLRAGVEQLPTACWAKVESAPGSRGGADGRARRQGDGLMPS